MSIPTPRRDDDELVDEGTHPVDLTSLPIAVVSRAGAVNRLNRAARALLGLGTRPLEGTRWSDLGLPSLEGASDEGEPFEVHHRLGRGERQTQLRITATEIVDGELPALLVELHDISEETAAAQAAFFAERRFAVLAASIDEAAFWLSLEPTTRFRYVNDAAIELTGYSAHEFYRDARLYERLVHREDAHLASIPTLAECSTSALVRLVRSDGELRWVEYRTTVISDDGSKPTDLLAVARDVTARHPDRRYTHRPASASTNDTAEVHTGIVRLAGAFAQALHTAESLCASDAVAIWWESGDEGGLELAAAQNFHAVATGHPLHTHRALPRARRGLEVVQQNEAARILDALPVLPAIPEEELGWGRGAAIRAFGRVVGILALYRRSTDSTECDDLAALQLAADALGASFETAQRDGGGQEWLPDPVTGLPNRPMAIHRLAQLLAAAQESPVILAVCDLDHFTWVREAHGPLVADSLLCQVVARLKQTAPGATLARTGGDEFTLVVSRRESHVSVRTLIRSITEVMSAPFDAGGQPLRLSLCGGITTGSGAAHSADDLLSAASTALRRAQAQGAGRWATASDDEHANSARRFEFDSGLALAAHRGEIRAWFQQITNLSDDSIVGFEALARWERPEGSTISPLEFIPAAERSGAIAEIGLAMLDQACLFLRRQLAFRDEESLIVTVNVSPRQLDDPDLPRRVATVLDAHGIPAERICLELTESALLPGDVDSRERLLALKELGVGLAIDDFGTGYCSLAYLTRFPVDMVKLARELVTGINADHKRMAVTRHIVALGRELGLTVLAEGIETIGERETMSALNCELGQGFLRGKPLPAPAAEALWRAELLGFRTP